MIALSTLLLAYLASCVGVRALSAPTIDTSCGPISGAVDDLPLGLGAVYRYSSIPYAAPPLSALRFRPPSPSHALGRAAVS